jgi:hypothetical protein
MRGGSLDFDLRFTRSNGNCQARVVRSPAGESEPVEFPLPDAELVEVFLLWAGIPEAPLGSHGPYGSGQLKEIGEYLFSTVFTGPVLDCLRASVDAAQRADATLRIRLMFARAEELAALPWELMRDEALGLLALPDVTSVARYELMDSPKQPLVVEPPLHVLIANPSSVDGYQEEMVQGLADLTGSGLLALHFVDIREVADTIQHGVFHILQLRDIEVDDYYDLLLDGFADVRLVVVDAGVDAHASIRESFPFTAAAAPAIDVPAVISRQVAAGDKAAGEFLPALYAALATGQPVDVAVAEARAAMWTVSHHSWASPVLHLGIDDARLFEISPSDQAMAAARVIEGDLQAAAGRLAHAEAHYRVALGLEPTADRAHAGLGRTLVRLGRLAELYRPDGTGWANMAVVGVRAESTSNNPLVLIRETSGDRCVPIWLGAVEATSITMAQQRAAAARPLVNDLLCLILDAVGLRLRYAAITSLQDGVFEAELSLSNGATVPARPSDAIALTLLTGAPLYMAGDILDRIGVQSDGQEQETGPSDWTSQPAAVPPPVEVSRTIELEVVGVRVEMPSNNPIVLLKEKDSDIYLPVWIGAVEAAAVAAAKEGTSGTEVRSHELMRDLLASAGLRLLNACFVSLANEVYYTDLSLSNGTTVSCRPSDAVILTLITQAPLYVSAELLEETGVRIPEEPEEGA